MLNQIVIFGASGDLTARKLIPSLLRSHVHGDFQGPVQVIGVARRPKTSEAWREELEGWLDDELREAWPDFARHVHYQAADTTVASQVRDLQVRLDELAKGPVGRLYYLALMPSLFGPTVELLDELGMLDAPAGDDDAFRRVIVEKPFGTDLASAQELNRKLLLHLREDQLYRIDHYLGKETVQNILTF
ncbi:MAG: glucose-6-phosphate dehydrogenase, partial [Myxococcota bacterium]|nr:glucose-6-phosphate dehydrogenase [Myxococcota bacterium]